MCCGMIQLGGKRIGRCIQMQCISSNPNPYKSVKYAVFGPLYAGGVSNSFCHLTVYQSLIYDRSLALEI